MKLIQCRFSSGQRIPLLVHVGDAAPLPVLIPFIYVQLKFRHRAYNTAAAHLRAIQAFYTYAKSRDINIDDAILACHFESILALLDGYAIWLQSGRQADNLVARIGKAETVPFLQIDPRTRDQYLRLLKQYLSWCVTRYIPRARQNSTTQANIEVVFADVADVIKRRFESHIINVRPDHARYRSLTDTQLQIIHTLIRPGVPENPFPERLAVSDTQDCRPKSPAWARLMAIRSWGQRNELLCRIRSLPHCFAGKQATAYEEFRILEIMLSACIYQVDRPLEPFQSSVLSERFFKAFQCNEQTLETKINRKTAPAMLCLVVQGSLPCGEFKMFTGHPSAEAKREVFNFFKGRQILGGESSVLAYTNNVKSCW